MHTEIAHYAGDAKTIEDACVRGKKTPEVFGALWPSITIPSA